MNTWKKLNIRWEKEQLLKMSSVFRILYLLIPLVIYYLVGDLVEIILWAVLNRLLEGASLGTKEWFLANNGNVSSVIYAVGPIIVLLIVYKMAKEEITGAIKGENKGKLTLRQVIILIAITLVFSVGLNYVFNILGITKMSAEYNSVYDNQFSINFILGLILYGVFSPIVEEVLFRGIIYNRLKRIFPVLLSIILSALLFGMFHGNIVQGTYGTLMGLIIALFYEKFDSFYAPVIIHSVANIAIYVLSYQVWK